jgi:hypothetical protein
MTPREEYDMYIAQYEKALASNCVQAALQLNQKLYEHNYEEYQLLLKQLRSVPRKNSFRSRRLSRDINLLKNNLESLAERAQRLLSSKWGDTIK